MAAPAAAHVTVQPNEAVAGSFSRFVVRVPNERDDASTTQVKVNFPPLAFVSFEDAVGWERQEKMGKSEELLMVFDSEVTEGVQSVTWSGGEVQPGEFAEFGFSARMPDGDETLTFDAIQTYSSGEVVKWTGAPDSEEPAPQLHSIVLPAEEGQGQLSVLADTAEAAASAEEAASAAADAAGQMDHTAAAPEEDDDSDSNLGVILGGIGIALGLIALIVALTRKPSSA
jgi:uncharacterized protein YcnI